MSDLDQDQINQLKSIGIFVDPIIQPQHKLKINTSSKFPSLKQLSPYLIVTTLSIASTLIITQYSQPKPAPLANSSTVVPNHEPSPTATTTVIQTYLLSSQQYFTQALSIQQNGNNNLEVVNLLNQAITAATSAIQNFPQDYRGFYQRGKIYQSLVDSKPELIPSALNDFLTAYNFNPNSAEINRDLASVYARQGNSQQTILFLQHATTIEPNKTQNYLDLAKIQQQIGDLSSALTTYNQLMPLLSDPLQIAQIQTEKIAIENILVSNPSSTTNTLQTPLPSAIPTTNPLDTAPTIQASSNTGLIIAAPETKKTIEVNNITSSNSLSGSTVLPANQKEISISNTNTDPNSQVYVTILKGGKNQTLQVLSKSTNSFTVGLDSPINEDIQFKWWIIN